MSSTLFPPLVPPCCRSRFGTLARPRRRYPFSLPLDRLWLPLSNSYCCSRTRPARTSVVESESVRDSSQHVKEQLCAPRPLLVDLTHRTATATARAAPRAAPPRLSSLSPPRLELDSPFVAPAARVSSVDPRPPRPRAPGPAARGQGRAGWCCWAMPRAWRPAQARTPFPRVRASPSSSRPLAPLVPLRAVRSCTDVEVERVADTAPPQPRPTSSAATRRPRPPLLARPPAPARLSPEPPRPRPARPRPPPRAASLSAGRPRRAASPPPRTPTSTAPPRHPPLRLAPSPRPTRPTVRRAARQRTSSTRSTARTSCTRSSASAGGPRRRRSGGRSSHGAGSFTPSASLFSLMFSTGYLGRVLVTLARLSSFSIGLENAC